MNISHYTVDQLESQFERQIVLNMKEMKMILGSNVDMTIYRNLKRLGYLSSYSHAGKYYSLTKLAQFDLDGLWHYKNIHFSRSGALKNTVINLLKKSEEGFLAKELQEILKVFPHNILLSLYNNNQIVREQIGSNYVYFHPDKASMQLKRRQQGVLQTVNTYQECLNLFLKGLNEKQLRLYAGLESIHIGYGGDDLVSKKLAINVKTVARGRKELLTKDVDFKRIRDLGGGRPSIKKTKKF